MPEVFGILDDLVQIGKLRFYGVSVEKVEEALKAIEYPNVQSVQIIYNIFRQRPADLFFIEARKRNVGILARVPLSSGMLTGKMTRHSTFEKDDHRIFNRHGEEFDRGETFSGVDYDLALEVVEQLRPLVPAGRTMTQFALKWILMNPAVTCAIPGAKNSKQAEENIKSVDMPPLSNFVMENIKEIYNRCVRPTVHHYW
jgi:aryl-alcohol dehydrogenase-like predicted oxidoreductase